jgi:REG-2-like HAD superfamily hydrolase
MKLLSLDAAGTLLDVRWDPARFAVEIAQEIGIEVDVQVGYESYQRLVHSRWREFQNLNLQRDAAVTDAFWRELTADWLFRRPGSHPPAPPGGEKEILDRFSAIAAEKLYSSDSPIFRLFPDTVPFLDKMKERDMNMVVLSNWDISLHRVLAAHDLTKYFDLVMASLEHGVEKPAPGIFQIVEDHFQLRGSDILHVGDDPVDDLHGARAFGWQSVLLDRSAGMTLFDTVPQ